MAQNTNSVILVGRLVRDPELRTLPGGTSLVDAGLAVSESRKDSAGKWIDGVSFFDIVIFGKTAEVATTYLKKGSKICIQGRLKQETWKDKNTGDNRSKVKIIVSTLEMLDGKPSPGDTSTGQEYTNAHATSSPTGSSSSEPDGDPSDSIPF